MKKFSNKNFMTQKYMKNENITFKYSKKDLLLFLHGRKLREAYIGMHLSRTNNTPAKLKTSKA